MYYFYIFYVRVNSAKCYDFYGNKLFGEKYGIYKSMSDELLKCLK
jgi:hypothetical protein